MSLLTGSIRHNLSQATFIDFIRSTTNWNDDVGEGLFSLSMKYFKNFESKNIHGVTVAMIIIRSINAEHQPLVTSIVHKLRLCKSVHEIASAMTDINFNNIIKRELNSNINRIGEIQNNNHKRCMNVDAYKAVVFRYIREYYINMSKRVSMDAVLAQYKTAHSLSLAQENAPYHYISDIDNYIEALGDHSIEDPCDDDELAVAFEKLCEVCMSDSKKMPVLISMMKEDLDPN